MKLVHANESVQSSTFSTISCFHQMLFYKFKQLDTHDVLLSVAASTFSKQALSFKGYFKGPIRNYFKVGSYKVAFNFIIFAGAVAECPEWSPNIYSQICNTAPCLYNISRPLGWSGGHNLYLFLTTLSFFIIHIILILFFINPHYSYPSLSTLGHTVLRGHNNLTFCDVVILVPVLSKKKHTFKMF